MPHFSHTTQEMTIQIKTLSWMLNFGHFQEMLYFAMILFKFCQAKIPAWIAISLSRRSSQPRNQAHISCTSFIGKQVLYQLSHQRSPKCLQFHIIIESRGLLYPAASSLSYVNLLPKVSAGCKEQAPNKASILPGHSTDVE